jgi:hypothetical protein
MFQSQGEARENVTILPKLKLRRKLKYLDLSAQAGAMGPRSYELNDAGFAAIGLQGERGDCTGRVKRRGPALPGLT